MTTILQLRLSNYFIFYMPRHERINIINRFGGGQFV